MKPLDQALRDAFLDAARRQGVAAGEVWDCVKWRLLPNPEQPEPFPLSVTERTRPGLPNKRPLGRDPRRGTP